MKIPYWNADITLYSRKIAADGAVSWRRSTRSGCFWQQRSARSRSDGGEFRTAAIICRIPAPYPDVKIGDIIVYGTVKDEIDEYTAGKRSADLMEKYAGRILQVSDLHYNQHGLPGADHLYTGG